jgi:hypothetical protein
LVEQAERAGDRPLGLADFSSEALFERLGQVGIVRRADLDG